MLSVQEGVVCSPYGPFDHASSRSWIPRHRVVSLGRLSESKPHLSRHEGRRLESLLEVFIAVVEDLYEDRCSNHSLFLGLEVVLPLEEIAHLDQSEIEIPDCLLCWYGIQID